jgi:hypothetical protein
MEASNSEYGVSSIEYGKKGGGEGGTAAKQRQLEVAGV